MQKYWIWIVWAVVLFSATTSQLLLKIAAQGSEGIQWTRVHGIIRYYAGNTYFWGAVILGGISFLAWLHILTHSRLSVAFNISALMYIIVGLQASIVLHEPLTLKYWLGTALITGGVIMTV